VCRNIATRPTDDPVRCPNGDVSSQDFQCLLPVRADASQKRWYAAHILMAVKRLGSRQRTFPIFENIVIFRAATPESVQLLAE
jgi:hypothetical protein